MPSYFEFFCGGGMVRAALDSSWRCLFANDFDLKKGESYRKNWGGESLIVEDIKNITVDDLIARSKSTADLAWASFPCQDLSLAGGGAGLRGERSGTFWPFWNLMAGLKSRSISPKIIVLENVCGTLTSHSGKDFIAICNSFAELEYRVGALIIDAQAFLPQSRPRLFFICTKTKGTFLPLEVQSEVPVNPWHPAPLLRAYATLPQKLKENWIWWRLPMPNGRKKSLEEIIDLNTSEIGWHSADETRHFISMMSDVNKKKLSRAKKAGKLVIGTMYRRTRYEKGIGKVQRIEVRFDGIAGCLRTPAGGSSRQLVIVVDGGKVRTRLISARETARLMGLRESYKLPENFNDALHLTGDGVVVPAVRHLKKHLFERILSSQDRDVEIAA